MIANNIYSFAASSVCHSQLFVEAFNFSLSEFAMNPKKAVSNFFTHTLMLFVFHWLCSHALGVGFFSATALKFYCWTFFNAKFGTILKSCGKLVCPNAIFFAGPFTNDQEEIEDENLDSRCYYC